MKKYIIIIGLLFLGINVSELHAQTNKNENPNAPEIAFEKTTHDFGKIQKNGNAETSFEFTNTGKEPLIIDNVRSNCGCTVPKFTREPILPGKKGEITAKYTTTNRVAPFHKQITVFSNAKNPTVILKIKGEVVDEPSPVENNTTDGATPTAK